MACLVPPGQWLRAAAIKPSMEFRGLANRPLGLPARETKAVIWASNIWMHQIAL